MTDSETPGTPEHHVTRRDFMKVMGGALGGVALLGTDAAASRGGGRGPLGSMPNGYYFYRVLNLNNPALGVSDVTTVVMMATPNNNPFQSFVYFHGQMTQELTDVFLGPGHAPADTLFKTQVLFPSPPSPTNFPTVQGLGPLVCQGQSVSSIAGVPASQLPILVSRIGTGDSNALGHYATTLTVEDLNPTVSVRSAPGVYLMKPETFTWTKVARFGDPAPDGGLYGGIFGDVALADDDTVTFVAAASQSSLSSQGSQGLFVADPSRPRAARALLRAGDVLPGTSAVIRAFGLVDVAADGGFVVQVSAARADAADRRPGTALIHGDLQQSKSSYRLLAASPHLVGRRGREGNVVLGDTYLGPRIARGGHVAHVTHTTAHEHGLTFRTRRGAAHLSRTGGRSRSGGTVASLGAPVVSDSGLVFSTELLDDGSSVLTISDGQTTQVLLKSGDQVLGPFPTNQITEILQGYHSRQADFLGRIAFTAEFLINPSGDPTDPNNVTTSLVIGVPI